MRAKPPLTLFGWPGKVGGSETKLAAVAKLMAGEFAITWVPNVRRSLSDRSGRGWIAAHGMRAAAWEELPPRLRGWGVALCNIPFLTEGRAAEAKGRGLSIAWGGEMMWAIPGELGAVAAGLVDRFLFASETQREVLTPALFVALGGAAGMGEGAGPGAHPAWGGTEGVLRGGARSLRWATVGNYVEAAAWPWRDRARGRGGRALTVGRLSRADWVKFPADFPRTYERLGLSGSVRYRVMAWSRALAGRWPRARWGREWELLPAMSEEPRRFLASLDLFVYDVHPRFAESWGRAVVEAMLTGAVPLVPADRRHHLRELVPHGTAGFHCATRREWCESARGLQADAVLRDRMSRAAGEWARGELCDAARHRATWRRVLG